METSWDRIKQLIEDETGFACYEGQSGDQTTFFGTSDKYDEFVELADENMFTGTVAFCMDTGDKYMYSAFTKEWYKLV